jgi:autophagy-related protein 16-1
LLIEGLAFCRDECKQLKKDLEDKIKALEIILSENTELKTHLEQMTIRAKSAEIEHKTLVDRMMLEKMKNAEQLNEV